MYKRSIILIVSNSDLYNYADDNCISVSHKDISAQLENEAQVMAKWFADNSMKANADKFQGILLPGGRENKDVQISLGCGWCVGGVGCVCVWGVWVWCVGVVGVVCGGGGGWGGGWGVSTVFAQRPVPKSLLYSV